MRLLGTVLVLAGLSGGAARAGVDARLVGEWSGQVKLRIEANGRCLVDQTAGKCQTLRSALFFQAPDGSVVTYGWRVKDDELTISGGGMAQPLVLRRATAGATASRAPAVSAPEPPAPAATGQTAGAGQAAGAGRFSHPYWGVDFAVPPRWKAAERDGSVLLGSDTEAGLMLVRFMPSTTRQALLDGYAEGMQEAGVTLAPAARAEEFAAGSNRGVAGELAGAAQNGARLRARAIGLLSPFGDAAVILGVTSTEQYGELKPKVDALAGSITFTKPKTPPANQVVAGQYYYIFTSSTGSSYSREDTLSLCSNGMFARKGEMYGSQAGQWGAASQSGYAGQWAADGDGRSGTIVLSYRDGRSERIRYEKSGVDIVLNGRKYGRFGDGSCARRGP